MKDDAELNREGAGEMQTAQLPLCDSDSCATSAHGDGEKQSPPASPAFPVNPPQTVFIHTAFFFIGVGSYMFFSHLGMKVRMPQGGSWVSGYSSMTFSTPLFWLI